MLVKCPVCHTDFQAKPFHLKRFKIVCCSRDCANEVRRERMSGAGNHQYGLRGDKNASHKDRPTMRRNGGLFDTWIYKPDHPFCNKDGRVKDYRLIVEENFAEFPSDSFIEIEGKYYLRKDMHVHHVDGNHYNHAISNLRIVTRSEHRRIHNIENPMPHNPSDGRFVKRSVAA